MTPTSTLLLGLLALGTISAKHLHDDEDGGLTRVRTARISLLDDGLDTELHQEALDSDGDGEFENHATARRGHSKYIVGGSEVADGECPWQVSILGDQRKFCGGTIITDRWVLTAAHCVIGVRLFNMVFGSLEMYGGEVDGTVRRSSNFAVPHNRYDRRNNDNDIALIKLHNPLQLTDSVAAIRLPSYSQQKETYIGEPAIVCGWGKTSDFGPNTGRRMLGCVAMPVISLAVCDRHFSGVTSKHICLDARDARGSCEGDSGGPLIWQDLDGVFTQIGLVSYGSKFCEDGAPGVYTRVSAYLGWIGWNTGIRVAP